MQQIQEAPGETSSHVIRDHLPCLDHEGEGSQVRLEEADLKKQQIQEAPGETGNKKQGPEV